MSAPFFMGASSAPRPSAQFGRPSMVPSLALPLRLPPPSPSAAATRWPLSARLPEITPASPCAVGGRQPSSARCGLASPCAAAGRRPFNFSVSESPHASVSPLPTARSTASGRSGASYQTFGRPLSSRSTGVDRSVSPICCRARAAPGRQEPPQATQPWPQPQSLSAFANPGPQLRELNTCPSEAALRPSFAPRGSIFGGASLQKELFAAGCGGLSPTGGQPPSPGVASRFTFGKAAGSGRSLHNPFASPCVGTPSPTAGAKATASFTLLSASPCVGASPFTLPPGLCRSGEDVYMFPHSPGGASVCSYTTHEASTPRGPGTPCSARTVAWSQETPTSCTVASPTGHILRGPPGAPASPRLPMLLGQHQPSPGPKQPDAGKYHKGSGKGSGKCFHRQEAQHQQASFWGETSQIFTPRESTSDRRASGVLYCAGLEHLAYCAGFSRRTAPGRR